MIKGMKRESGDTVDWEKVKNPYNTLEKARQAADIVATTEGRLASQRGGPQYEVETRIEQEADSWYIYWRKVPLPPRGCASGCGSCGTPPKKPTGRARVLPFKRKTD
jgi:hypothetical protein